MSVQTGGPGHNNIATATAKQDVQVTLSTVDDEAVQALVTLGADVDTVKAFNGVITGYASGGASGNMSSCYQATLLGDSNDSDHEYQCFWASTANKNGGDSDMIAFSADTGFDDLIAAASGNISFEDYEPQINNFYDSDITAATEMSSLIFNGDGDTKTWAAGAGPLATQKDWVFNRASYSGNAGGALTITEAATVYIENAPSAGANMTITNPYALWVDAGISKFDGPVRIGAADTYSHLASLQQNVPTTTLTNTTLNDGGGSGASITMVGSASDMRGGVQVVAGGGGTPGAGIAGQIVFNQAYATAPKMVILTAANAGAADKEMYVNAIGTTSFEVAFNAALGVGEQADFYYMVVE